MEWTPQVNAGDWLGPLVNQTADWQGSMHDVVPRGFAAYARVFHPAARDRPVGREWPAEPFELHRKQWQEFQSADPQIVEEKVTWAATAAAMGTTMHPLAQWHRLIAPKQQSEQAVRDAAGWRYSEPPQGDVDAKTVAVVAEHLAAATSTPRSGYLALWNGHGGLLGFIGTNGSRAFFQLGADDSETVEHHNRMIETATKDPFNQVFTAPSWQPGILSKEISEGPHLELPGREYVLFRGGIAELASEDWFLRVPWRDTEAELHGFAPDALAPNLSWPDDHAWVQVTEVDYDSTIIGGSEELIAALCADPRLEAASIPTNADLSWDGDQVNR